MDRPYIICHMLTSLDGKVIGEYLQEGRTAYFSDEYERIHERYGHKAWMCGRITMEEHFTLGHQLDLPQENVTPIPRTDHVADTEAVSFAIAVDPSGKLGWTQNCIPGWNEGRTDDHIIEVLTEQVSDAYLAHLRQVGISYVFGGRERLDFTVVAQKLKKLFSIEVLMLEGGGVLNGSFLKEGLIDELSLILVPVADGAANSVTLFESEQARPVHFDLQRVEKLDDGGLWMQYVAKRG